MYLRDAGRLRALTLICDLGSISAAATVLGYTSSAVSQQLAALEREVGTTLVDRTRRPFRPTPAGAALRPDIDRALAALAAAEATLAGLRAGAPRRIRLAAFASALASFIPAALRDLHHSHPDVGIQVLELETREALGLVTKGEADLAVVHYLPTDSVPELVGIERHPLLRDELQVVIPQGHRLAARPQVRLADLANEPLLVPHRDTPAGPFRSLVEHLCAQAGFSPQVAYEVDNHSAAQAFASAGVAIVLMHRLLVSPPRPGVVVRPVAASASASRIVEAVVPAGHRSPVVDVLLDHLVEATRREQRGPHRDSLSRPVSPGPRGPDQR